MRSESLTKVRFFLGLYMVLFAVFVVLSPRYEDAKLLYYMLMAGLTSYAGLHIVEAVQGLYTYHFFRLLYGTKVTVSKKNREGKLETFVITTTISDEESTPSPKEERNG